MACCFEELENYAVTPMLISQYVPEQCYERPPICCTSLPRCRKGEIIYSEKPQAKCCKKTVITNDNSCSECPKQSQSPQLPRRQSCPSQDYCPTCNNPCKPMKTKYVIPCYRYEDGRIVNQPTVLMRRACEVAVGVRPRRKPFVQSCYSADSEQEVHRYVSQDERGNCCYHFEKKKKDSFLEDCQTCHSYPHCGDGVRASVVPGGNCAYYYCR